MTIHRTDGEPREDHVSETPPMAVFRGHVDGDAFHGRIPGKRPRDLGKLIFTAACPEPRVRIIVGDLLQAEDVEIGESPGVLNDARWVDAPVDTATPLNIP